MPYNTTLDQEEAIIRRLLAAHLSHDSLLDYVRITTPDPRDPDDVRRSRYVQSRVHEAIARELYDLERRKNLRLIINCPPRHGKTELASKKFMSWYSGRHPEQHLIFGTYNETYASDVGRAVRSNIESLPHQQVFPDHFLKAGSASQTRLETVDDGMLMFVGRGGPITGRGGHGIILDDPIKDREEADSPLIRDKLWDWFNQVLMTRLMEMDSWVLIVQTRWHEDDLVGRLTDPNNPFYNEAEARQWRIVDLPALALENDPLGRAEGEALWPERFPKRFLLGQQRRDPRGFQALYQGRPTAETGSFFQKDWIRTYKPNELPHNLRYYCASDHAVSTRQDRDKTCLIAVGVDEKENIYVLPDIFWRHAPSDVVVDAMIGMMKQHRPIFWWAERGHISKAIGPFLRKRMDEERAYTTLIEVTPVADKMTRAQSIAGRVSMGKVYFPEHASWWPKALDEMMKFPHGTHDDFVDAMAYIGLGLLHQTGAVGRVPQKDYAPGTFGAMFRQTRQAEQAASNDGW